MVQAAARNNASAAAAARSALRQKLTFTLFWRQPERGAGPPELIAEQVIQEDPLRHFARPTLLCLDQRSGCLLTAR